MSHFPPELSHIIATSICWEAWCQNQFVFWSWSYLFQVQPSSLTHWVASATTNSMSSSLFFSSMKLHSWPVASCSWINSCHLSRWEGSKVVFPIYSDKLDRGWSEQKVAAFYHCCGCPFSATVTRRIARLRRALRKRVWKREAMVYSEGCNVCMLATYKTKHQRNERTVLINLWMRLSSDAPIRKR